METCNRFSVQDWREGDDRLSIVLLDLSGSTGATMTKAQRTEQAEGEAQTCSILSYSKDYVMSLAPVLSKGRCVLIGCSSRCDECALKAGPFCNCEPRKGCTRVLFRSTGPCSPQAIRDALAPLEPEGQTFVAAPIASLASVALEEGELAQRQRAQWQSHAFLMATHPRLGAASPAAVLPIDLACHVTGFLGNVTTHARVIMAIDGDNNVPCGNSACEACASGRAKDCPLNGPEGVTHAVQRLLQGSDGISINVEMNIAMIGEGSNRDARDSLKALCTATGGRYDAVREHDEGLLAETFEFYETTVLCPPCHVQARVAAVATYLDLVRARQVLDCGVRTIFVAKDHACVEELRAADAHRQGICEKIHGVPCCHGEDRAACLHACKARLAAANPFYQRGTDRHPELNAAVASNALGELLDASLFIAKNFKLLGEGGA